MGVSERAISQRARRGAAAVRRARGAPLVSPHHLERVKHADLVKGPAGRGTTNGTPGPALLTRLRLRRRRRAQVRHSGPHPYATKKDKMTSSATRMTFMPRLSTLVR